MTTNIMTTTTAVPIIHPPHAKTLQSMELNDDELQALDLEERLVVPVADDHDDANIEDLDMYKLDFEEQNDMDERFCVAAGGEILQPGDHIYMWCTMYQHHGIVLDTNDSHAMRIAEFTNAALVGVGESTGTNGSGLSFLIQSTSVATQAASGNGVTGGFRIVLEPNPRKWHCVKYHANPIECLTWRPGTCSGAQPSPVETTLLRVQFLQECKHWIPDYHVLTSNCETVAVWCKSGKWQTLQGGRAMQLSQLGAISSTALIPTIPVVGLVASGLAMWHSQQISSRWTETEERLNKEFDWFSMGKAPRLSLEAEDE
eukprot:Nitzschia sp. Nitz4//scaffold68_size99682//83730//84674//NITZ4_004575-RA/size99682-processed-gene-0.82-mRNA-1//1//CDS//3329556626//1874//frame0